MDAHVSAGRSLSLTSFRKLFGDLASGAILTLDDRRILVRGRQSDAVAALIERERMRLRFLLTNETRLRRQGYRVVAGVDEVGRGPLAGPLVAAAVVFKRQPWIPLLDDSKRLTPHEREAVFGVIFERASAVGVGVLTVDDLNATNMHAASLEAMRRALISLEAPPDCVLVDGIHAIPRLECHQRLLARGDSLSLSIAAASIVAKVIRDRHMDEQDSIYPQYGFKQNKGYGTPEHLQALERAGPSPIHRRRFAPVARMLGA